VLQAIETLDCSKEFNRLNFQPNYYLDARNRAQPMYYITRDGFSFLVMGFTGIQAARFKEDFINAFNRMEKHLQSLDPSNLTRMEILQMAIESEQKCLQLQDENEKLFPKAVLMDKVLDSESLVDIGQAAKILELPYGRNRLFARLKQDGIFFRNRNEPRQEFIDRGYFRLKEVYLDHLEQTRIKVLVTQKGLDFLARHLEVIATQKKHALIS
jgi:Rha family phage regulatory protein